MKKRIISFVLMLAMIFCLVPCAVSAEGETHTVTFEITKLDGSLIDFSLAQYEVKNASGTKFYAEQDEYGWDLNYFYLPDGDYTYRVEYSRKERAEGEFTVSGSDITIQAQTETIYYPVKFDVQPENADIKLYKAGASGAYGDPIMPNEEGVYPIPFGYYRYIISAEGYETVNKSFNATDTSLKNNNYVIKVKLKSIYDAFLEDVYDTLYDETGEPVVLNEFTGNLYEYGDEFIPWDIDSDYDDTNVLDYAYDIISDEEFEGVTLGIADVYKDTFYYYDEDESTDYSVIGSDGVIHYDAVNESNITEDEDYGTGAYYIVEISISYNGVKYDDTVDFTFVVPEHIKTRGERLNEAADYAVKDIPETTDKDIVLPTLSEDGGWSEYFIDTKWESDNEDVISSSGKVTLPAKDTVVTLTMTAFYMDWYIEDAGYMLDPGPDGDDVVREVKVLVPGTSFDVTVENSYAEDSGEGSYKAGDTVTVHAGTRDGYKFAGWTAEGAELDNSKNSDATFVMPKNNVKLTAAWEKNEDPKPDPKPDKPSHDENSGKIIADLIRYRNMQKKNGTKSNSDKTAADTAIVDNEVSPFTDVNKSDAFFEDVLYCYENEIMLGTSDDEFTPYGNATRAMIVTVLWRMEGEPVVNAVNMFADVENGTWYSDAVVWAEANGIVNGYGDGRFGPEDSITREQLAAIIARYARFLGCEMPVEESAEYDDFDAVSDWAVNDVCSLTSLGIIEAEEGNTFAPKSDALRYQIAKALHRFCETFAE